MRQIKKGSTNVSVHLYIVDNADGTPETGVTFNSPGMDLKYRREGAAAVNIAEVSLGSLSASHLDGGFIEVGNGLYRLDVPDAAFATGANHVTIFGAVTGMIVLPLEIQLVDNIEQDTFNRLGAPAGASVSADIAAVKGETAAILDDTGTSGVVLSSTGLQTSAVQEIRDAITGGAWALSTDSNGRIRLVVGTGTGEITLASGRVAITEAQIDQIVDEVWDEPTASHTLAQTFGEQAQIGIFASVNDAGAAANQFIGTSGLSSSNDFYNGSVLVFMSGNLRGIARKIEDYTGATRTLIFTANPFPSAPTNGSRFIILGRIN